MQKVVQAEEINDVQGAEVGQDLEHHTQYNYSGAGDIQLTGAEVVWCGYVKSSGTCSFATGRPWPKIDS